METTRQLYWNVSETLSIKIIISAALIIFCAGLYKRVRPLRKSVCCGGGGGLTFMNVETGIDISVLRSEQAVKTKADIVVSACPYCLYNLSEGMEVIKGDKKSLNLDLAEVILGE